MFSNSKRNRAAHDAGGIILAGALDDFIDDGLPFAGIPEIPAQSQHC
jgi:hypothetical protein